MTLTDLFAAALVDRAAAPALDGITHGEVHARAARVAAQLRARGVVRGDRVAIYCENRPAFVYAYLAILRLGAIAVPANVLYRASDLAWILEDADPRCMIVGTTTREHAEALAHHPPLISADEVDAWANDAQAEQPAAEVVTPDDVALLVYTSGTTGRSKGAMLTHGNIATIVTQLITAWRWTPSDTLVIALPLFHIHGLVAALTTTLVCGAQIVVHERFDAQAILARLRRPDATMFFGVPTMYVRLLDALGDGEAPRLRLYVSGSAALAADVHDAFAARFHAAILERYGATEFGFALGNRYGGPRVAGSVGTTFPGVTVRVAAPDGVAALAPGEVGELLVRGANVFAGYWKNPTATQAAFAIDEHGERWYRSGDLARYDAEYDVYRIVGRIKELIITGGFNVYPREVEEAIDAFPGVRASAVVGIPDRARGELPVAFVETHATIDVDALLAALRDALASFKIPKAVHVVDALPRNAMGKIEKTRLRERAL